MKNFEKITLAYLLLHADQTIKRHALGILKRLRELQQNRTKEKEK